VYQSLFEKPVFFQLVEKYSTFYETQQFIDVSTRVRHRFLSCVSPQLPIVHPEDLFNSVLLCTRKYPFSFGVSYQNVSIYFLLCHALYMTSPAHLNNVFRQELDLKF
jgi:hypothetical protein